MFHQNLLCVRVQKTHMQHVIFQTVKEEGFAKRLLQIQEEGTENRISEARRKYNDAVQAYNQTARKMPTALIAGIFNFQTMPKFEAAAGAEKAPDLDI